MTPFLIAALTLAAPPDKPSTLDEKIAAALKNHPDIKAAEAKRLLADAEVEQARLLITQKVTAAASRVELAKAKLLQVEEEVAVMEKVLKLGNAVSELERATYLKARPMLIGAKAELAAAELELQQLVGKGGATDAKLGDPNSFLHSLNRDPFSGPLPPSVTPEVKLPTGPAVDKLAAVLNKPFKLDVKDGDFPTGLAELVKAAGLDGLTVRGTKTIGGDYLKEPPKVGPLTGEMTFAAWVQLMLDGYNGDRSRLPLGMEGKLGVYVREYGLLVEQERHRPADAVSLAKFAEAVKAKADKATAGPVLEKLEAALGKTVKLDLGDNFVTLPDSLTALLKATGQEGVQIRGGQNISHRALKVDGVSFSSAFQMILDQTNADGLAAAPDRMRYEVYVRDYGLLIERVDVAPKDAVTLTEFIRQVQAKRR